MSDIKECNIEVITKLEQLRAEEKTDEDESNPTWDKLKGIFNN